MADQGSEGLLSPYLRQRRIAAALPFLRGRILDVGCGSGALAKYVDNSRYVGLEPDTQSIVRARASHPEHTFLQAAETADGNFDTVIALAVIEHVPDPVAFLKMLKNNLRRIETARIVCTTPHPSMDWVHWLGSQIGIFSRSANEEHEDLLDREKLLAVASRAGLREAAYRRFLGGANQVVAFAHDDV